MAKKIIVLSDGTGNAASSVWRTNVWRIFQSLKLDSFEQAAHYDDGVGTSSFKPLAILGGAFGYGLKRNVLESYKFICRNYDKEGSKLYFFGFSRGAFTVRVLTALVLQQGLVQASSDSELHDLARKAYRAYRANGYQSILRLEQIGRRIRDLGVAALDVVLGRTPYTHAVRHQPASIEFIGVWDTVAAYGLPADEMTKGISDWIWPLELPNRVLSEKVLCARHALALDDERTTFHPVLWTEEGETRPAGVQSYRASNQRILQVWFTGVHANVGGGYPDDSLAFTPLYWLVREAKLHGLNFKEAPEADPDTEKWIRAARDPDGRLYDSRSGIGGYYRYGPRNVSDLSDDVRVGVSIAVPKIHHSVFERIDTGCNSYAPIGLPRRYDVLNDDGEILPVGCITSDGKSMFETEEQADRRFILQQRIWNYVWLRRTFYFLTLAATFHLVLFWLFHSQQRAREFESPVRMISEALRAAQAVLPGWTKWWIDLYATNPVSFTVGVFVLIGTILVGSYLSQKIHDDMRSVWHSGGVDNSIVHSRTHDIFYALRTSGPYRAVVNVAKYWLFPGLFALATVLVVITAASHVLFNVADSMGAYCHGSKSIDSVNKGIAQEASSEFDVSSICASTGLSVQEGFLYEIVLDVTQPWQDGSIPTSPVGFRSGEIGFPAEWVLRSSVLLRRIIWRPWFRAIARVGETGVDEYFLDPKRVAESNTRYRDTFRARRSGEVFLYVNDATVGLPWLSSIFYDGTLSRGKNQGKARVTLRLCDVRTC